jgi:hypothetical protein
VLWVRMHAKPWSRRVGGCDLPTRIGLFAGDAERNAQLQGSGAATR